MGVAFEGTVISGLGKGAVFVAISHYKSQIKDKLGFTPFNGTLNLAVNKDAKSVLKRMVPIRVEPFKKDEKVYGGAVCYKAKISGIESAIIIPDLTEHEENILEIISPVNLKSALKIKDGDKIMVGLAE